MKKICLDACTIINFLKPKDEEVFSTFRKFIKNCKEHSEFATTDYIFEQEITKHQEYTSKVASLLKIYQVPASFYLEEPPSELDMGEWSIFKLIEENEGEFCVLSDDENAREFFERKKLLPCTHINPPPKGVGGTIGILLHLCKKGEINYQKSKEIVKKMKEHKSRLPEMPKC
ncbi:hypothetical protein [Desulfurobacterium sp.]